MYVAECKKCPYALVYINGKWLHNTTGEELRTNWHEPEPKNVRGKRKAPLPPIEKVRKDDI